jgi:general secretion pathway protein F/type IV pilus assembly protein PilC
MVRAGGEGGFLEEALTRVAQFTEAQEDLKKRTLGAIAYPVFLSVVGTIIVIVLIVFFVPKFEEMFARLRERGELPPVTDWLLWLSDTLRTHGWWILLALIAGGWFARRWLNTPEGCLWRDRMQLKLPLAGAIFQSLAVARFCRVLGTLLRNGVPILRSLEISRNATGNRVLGEAIGQATENISAGQSLAEPLRASGRFPPAVVEMIGVAEQANNLENVLLGVADSLEKNTWRKLDLAVRLIEPILLLLLAIAVLLVVIALLLPIMRMSQAI